MTRLVWMLLMLLSPLLAGDDDGAGPPISEEEFRKSENITEADDEAADDAKEQFRGDINMDIEDWNGENRNAVRSRKWPDAIIPYKISSEYTDKQRLKIAKAIKTYHDSTCIRWKPRNGEENYVFIQKGDGCNSDKVGPGGGKQVISLGNGCLYVGTILHEFMHAVGFWHEQSRTDRDYYVTIHWPNIEKGERHNFAKYHASPSSGLQLLGPYDYCSIMHYGKNDFRKHGINKPAITTLRELEDCDEIGNRKGFSKLDIEKLNTLYQCEGYPQLKPCEDKAREWCEKSAKEGKCSSDQYQAYMMQHCRKSCDFC